MNMEVDIPQVYLLGKTYLTNNEKIFIQNDSIVNMAAGERHSIIVMKSGRTYTFGDNNSGQLGLGHNNTIERVSCIQNLKFSQTDEKIILAACGYESSLVATNYGSLYAFGSNHRCQLGVESNGLITTPIKIEYFHSKMSWKQLSMGGEHTCVLTNDGRVYLWGSNEFGQCGFERKYEMIKIPQELKLEYSVDTISCGYSHTALISKDGRLFLFGNNSYRQLGCSIPDEYIGPFEVLLTDLVRAVACGNQHTVILTEKGDVYTCGRGDRGQLGLGRKIFIGKYFQMIENLPKHWITIAAGATHTAIINSYGELYLFGDGKYGKLNYETDLNQLQPYFIDQFKEYNVLDVVCGGCQTIIYAKRKSIECTTDFKMKPIKNIVRNNRTDSIDEISKNRNLSLNIQSISNSNELSTSTENILINTIYVETNEKLQLRNYYTDNNKIESIKPVLFNKTTNDLIISTNDNKKRSLSDERSIPISEQSNEKNSLVKNDSQKSCHTSSSTNSGCTSSSISSLQDENPIISSDSSMEHSFYSSCTTKIHGKSYIIDSTDKSITTQTKIGFLSRIFNGKSSRKLSIQTNTNSRICSIM